PMSFGVAPARATACSMAWFASLRALRRTCRVPVVTATVSIVVALPSGQLLGHFEQDDTDLQLGGERDQRHLVSGMQAAFAQLFHQRDEVGGRGGVAVPVDGD